jgi:hypothetical protein
LACFIIFFLLALLATEFTDLGIILLFFCSWRPEFNQRNLRPYSKVIEFIFNLKKIFSQTF